MLGVQHVGSHSVIPTNQCARVSQNYPTFVLEETEDPRDVNWLQALKVANRGARNKILFPVHHGAPKVGAGGRGRRQRSLVLAARTARAT